MSAAPVDPVHDHALGKPGAWLDSPWDGDLVAKVGPGERGKIFAFLGASTLGVKCGRTREEADEWLDRYPEDTSVMAYIGRSGWNSLRVAGEIPVEELCEAIDESYDLVVARMPRTDRPQHDS